MGKVAIAVLLFIFVGAFLLVFSKWKEPAIVIQSFIVTAMILLILKESGRIDGIIQSATKTLNGVKGG